MHDIINYSTSICPFESGKNGKEEGKTQKFEYLENETSFLNFRWNKKHFSVFVGVSFGEKNKNLIKMVDSSFKHDSRIYKFIDNL